MTNKISVLVEAPTITASKLSVHGLAFHIPAVICRTMDLRGGEKFTVTFEGRTIIFKEKVFE